MRQILFIIIILAPYISNAQKITRFNNIENDLYIRNIIVIDKCKYVNIVDSAILKIQDTIPYPIIETTFDTTFALQKYNNSVWCATSKNQIYKIGNYDNKITFLKGKIRFTKNFVFFDNKIWIASSSNGIYVYNENDSSVDIKLWNDDEETRNSKQSHITDIIVFNKTVWASTRDGLYKYNNTNKKFEKVIGKTIPKKIIKNLAKHENTLYAASRNTIWKYDLKNKKWKIVLDNDVKNAQYYLNSKDIRKIKGIKDIECDSYGNLWIAANKIVRYDINNNFVSFDFTYQDATCIATENKQGEELDSTIVWIGTEKHGLHKLIDRAINPYEGIRNIIFVINTSISKKDLDKIEKGVKLWSNFIDDNDKITIIAKIKKSRRTVDSTLIEAKAKEIGSILKVFKSIKIKKIKIDYKLIKHTYSTFREGALERSDNRIYIVTKSSVNRNDSIKKIITQYQDKVRFNVIMIENKSKFLSSCVEITDGGKYYKIKDNSWRNICEEEFGLKPFIFEIYIGSNFSLNNNAYLKSSKDIVEFTDLEPGKKNGWGVDFKVDIFFNEHSENIKWGIGFGIERNLYKSYFELNDYKEKFLDMIDKDQEVYDRNVYGNNIKENLKFLNWNIYPYLILKYSLIPEKLDIFTEIGTKFVIASKKIENDYNGKYTYNGEYDKYGGAKLPLHDLDDYGFITNHFQYQKEDIVFNQSNEKKSFYKRYFINIGVSYYFSHNLKANLTIRFSKIPYLYKTEAKGDYYLTKNVAEHNSIAKTRNYEGGDELSFGLGITYRITNKKILKLFKKDD